ncbi:hypothetical protein Nepgr_001068 [Nepenthes gracilis]|uniref:Uncharacterized protein n=1 Tax=Nepenthes gracilis TaxID=150966 RepID=A0AAD3P7K7_NEPGR|nr:hypothetical protein Nepgr_001068 [Nepenthes gracilis]
MRSATKTKTPNDDRHFEFSHDQPASHDRTQADHTTASRKPILNTSCSHRQHQQSPIQKSESEPTASNAFMILVKKQEDERNSSSSPKHNQMHPKCTAIHRGRRNATTELPSA